ncbi:unnamed protein product [Eruca vesicaria subsp. sativa]|uniref:TIR domain-containing protein n=1 Tax=Eruca vesicaria subsp. sativa TaxID=29727 RepID=A0ABC8L942_ERUVS|nr:unnamed protein product [Eruca vesicaria subsp. sativa]
MAYLPHRTHQVFINFRGKDLRYGFASHLIDAFERHSINFFIDTHEQKGRDLKHLFKRIEEATVALILLSIYRYGESKWCLEELRRIMEQAEREELIVIPIFYKVTPKEVRKQKGAFGSKFLKRTEKSSREEMEKWQVALKAVSNKIGFTLEHNRSESKFIKKVVKEVEKVVTATHPNEGNEKYCLKKVTTYDIPLAFPWAWFGSTARLIVAVLLGFGLLANTINKGASPAMVTIVGQTGSAMASYCCRRADGSI